MLPKKLNGSLRIHGPPDDVVLGIYSDLINGRNKTDMPPWFQQWVDGSEKEVVVIKKYPNFIVTTTFLQIKSEK